MKIGMASPGSQLSEDSNSSVEGEIISTAVKQGRSLRVLAYGPRKEAKSRGGSNCKARNQNAQTCI